jgi:hypothetical protein
MSDVRHFYRGSFSNPTEIHEDDCQGCRLERAEQRIKDLEAQLAHELEWRSAAVEVGGRLLYGDEPFGNGAEAADAMAHFERRVIASANRPSLEEARVPSPDRRGVPDRPPSSASSEVVLDAAVTPGKGESK